MLDICPVESGDALALRFIAESGRFVETGNLIAAMLARIYLPGVLGAAIQPLDLPAMVPVGMPAVSHEQEPSHRWRR
jgi:hypothetical protein